MKDKHIQVNNEKGSAKRPFGNGEKRYMSRVSTVYLIKLKIFQWHF